jgi:hypothetical protein
MVSGHYLALLLIFGFGHPAREPVDPAKSVQLHSRIPCDGYGGPEEAVHVQMTFSSSPSSGGAAREFVVNRFQNETCEINLGIKCLRKEKAGWHYAWSATSGQSSANGILPLESCYEWGSKEPAQYILSGWYQEGASDSKLVWRQAAVKQVSSQPEVYEFSAPDGGTARIELKH